MHDATNSFHLYDAAFANSLEIESSGGFELGFVSTVKAWMAGKRATEIAVDL